MEEDNANPSASGTENQEIKNQDGNLSGANSDPEDELLIDIIHGTQKNDLTPDNELTAGQGLIDVPQSEEDEYEDDDFESDAAHSSSTEELTTGVYSQSSQDVLTTFDFSKKTPKLDENDNPLSIPSTPPELSFSEVISVNIINHMKRDPFYAASILTMNGHKGTIDTILSLQEDSASLVCKEEGINELLDELLPGNSSEDGATKKSYSNRPFLHQPEPGWLTHAFIDLLTTELKRLRVERAEQKWSDQNAPKMQTLNKAVQSVDEVRAAEISNSGSEPSLNYSGADYECLKGGITPVPALSLIPENEDDTTDIIASEDNSKLLNFCNTTGEDEIVNFPVDASQKPPRSSVVHCLAGVQELPDFLGPTIGLNLPESNFGYCTAENKRMLNMGQQTDSEPSSPRGGVHMLGNDFNILNEENPYPDSVIHAPPFLPNRPTASNTARSTDSDDDLNDFFFKTREDSDEDDGYVNNLSTIKGIKAEKKSSEEKGTNTVNEGQEELVDNLVLSPEVVETGDIPEIVAEPSVQFSNDTKKNESETGDTIDEAIENDPYADEIFIDEETVDKVEDEIKEYISILALTEVKVTSSRTESESEGDDNELVETETNRIPAESEPGPEVLSSTSVESTNSQGNVSEDNSKCGANFQTNSSSIFYKYTITETSTIETFDDVTEDIPKADMGPVVSPQNAKAGEVKKKYLGESILKIVAADRSLGAEEEPETLSGSFRKIDVVSLTDKSVLRNERLAKAKKYSAAQSHKLGTSSSGAAGGTASGKLSKPGTSSAAVAGTSGAEKANKPCASKSGKVNAKLSPIQVRNPSSTLAGKTIKEQLKAKNKPILTDASTSASNLDSQGPSGAQAQNSALPSVSSFSTATPEKSKIRKGARDSTVKPKTRSKPIPNLTQRPSSYAQKRRDGSVVGRPTTSTANTRPSTAAAKEKEEPRPSTSKKSAGKPIWR